VASSFFCFEKDPHGLSHPFQKAKLSRDVHKPIVSLEPEAPRETSRKSSFIGAVSQFFFPVRAYSTGGFFFKKNSCLERGNSLRIQKDIDKMQNEN
jgi:hypothetical protein